MDMLTLAIIAEHQPLRATVYQGGYSPTMDIHRCAKCTHTMLAGNSWEAWVALIMESTRLPFSGAAACVACGFLLEYTDTWTP